MQGAISNHTPLKLISHLKRKKKFEVSNHSYYLTFYRKLAIGHGNILTIVKLKKTDTESIVFSIEICK